MHRADILPAFLPQPHSMHRTDIIVRPACAFLRQRPFRKTELTQVPRRPIVRLVNQLFDNVTGPSVARRGRVNPCKIAGVEKQSRVPHEWQCKKNRDRQGASAAKNQTAPPSAKSAPGWPP
jgi:hypothetical protein